MNELILIIGISVLLAILFQNYRSINEIRQKTNKGFDSLLDKIQNNKDKIEEIKEVLDEVRYNTLPSLEKEKLVFENARTFSLADVRQLKQGDTLCLISQSYVYPEDEPHIDRFEYKHDHLDETARTEFGCPVHGFWRFSKLEDWSPYQFLAKDDECTTISCEGTIKRLL